MNTRFALLEMPGRIAVTGGDEIEYQRVEAFRLAHSNRYVEHHDAEGKVKRVPIGTWWLGRPSRRSYKDVGFFAPPLVAPPRMLNLWQGFAVEPRKGDWSLMREHIRAILASGDATLDEYLVRWVAWVLQNPGLPAEVAVVLRGLKGTGKGAIANQLCKIFGVHATAVARPDLFASGRFNGHLDGCALLFADEALWAGNKEHEGALKAMITEPTIMIERKGIDARRERNALSIIIASNNEWVVPATMDERRFAVAAVSDERRGDVAYFAALFAQMENGGCEAMLHDLLALDLAGWHPRKDVPDTAALRDQKEASLPAEQVWLLGLLDSGVLPTSDLPGWATSAVLVDQARVAVPYLKGKDMKWLSPRLKAIGCEATVHRERRGWRFPPLNEARAAWERLHWSRPWSEVGRWSQG